jgi:ribosomal protein L21E
MDQPVSNPPKKSGGALKWILLGCGGILLIGAAFIGIMGYLAYRSFNTDPVKVEAAAQEILTFQKPEGFRGVASVSIAGFRTATLCSGAAGQPGNSCLVLVTMPGGRTNQEQMRAKMKENMEKQGQSQEVVEKRKAETFKVRGKDVDAGVDVTVHKGASDRMLQYTLTVDNASGNAVIVLLTGPEKQADHEWVQKFLDTVK